MKNIVIIFALMLATAHIALAQGEKNNRMQERIEAFRVAFITEKLGLTPDEAQKFWPIYNQYRDAQKKIREATAPKKRIEDMTDVEAEQFVTANLDAEQRELALKKESIQKLKGNLPPRKIATLQRAEREFKEEILRKAKEMRQQRKENRKNMLED